MVSKILFVAVLLMAGAVWADDYRILDRDQKVVGYLKDGKIYDKDWRVRYYLKDGALFDEGWNRKGSVEKKK